MDFLVAIYKEVIKFPAPPQSSRPAEPRCSSGARELRLDFPDLPRPTQVEVQLLDLMTSVCRGAIYSVADCNTVDPFKTHGN
ncbi:MAG: hypothetical protein V3R77_02965 [Candidatus Binatia bacterium]